LNGSEKQDLIYYKATASVNVERAEVYSDDIMSPTFLLECEKHEPPYKDGQSPRELSLGLSNSKQTSGCSSTGIVLLHYFQKF